MAKKRSTAQEGGDQGQVGIVPWRRRRLERAGFAAPLAQALAGDVRVDVHALLELVDRGCPPDLAARIQAPLDGPIDPATRTQAPPQEPIDAATRTQAPPHEPTDLAARIRARREPPPDSAA